MPQTNTPPKPFTLLQKFGIVATLLALMGAIWFFTSGRASTTVGLTLTTNPTLETGLVGHWTFDGDLQIRINDNSGNGFHGYFSTTSQATTSMVVAGKMGQAVTFDNDDDFIRTTNGPEKQVGARTICLWLYPLSLPGAGIKGLVNQPWGFYFRIQNNKLEARVYNTAGTFSSTYKSNYTLPVNSWTHACQVNDATDSGPIQLVFYVNGTMDSEIDTDVNGINSGTPGPGHIRIGDDQDAANRNFDGHLDDVRIYDRVLSADEVKRLYQLGN